MSKLCYYRLLLFECKFHVQVVQLTDNDQVFENVHSNTPKMFEARYMPQLSSIKDVLSKNYVFYWIDNALMVADCLTKTLSLLPNAAMTAYRRNKLDLTFATPHVYETNRNSSGDRSE